MKVTINAGGRVVEIDSGDEEDMSVHRLANIAIATWRRTESDGPEDLGPASGCGTERRPVGWGFTWRMGRNDQLDVQ